MSRATLSGMFSAMIAAALCASAAGPAAGQAARKNTTAAAAVLKTPWGEPDLQGI